MLNRDEKKRIMEMLHDPERQKDAASIWLCEKVIELNQRLAELRALANKR